MSSPAEVDAPPMTPERWALVKELFHATIERPSADRSGFLAAQCGSDTELRAEVDRLLAAHAQADTFLEWSPVAATAANTGTILGHYELLELIGSGGMGEVYRARDTRLGRDVALKMLPAALAVETERLRRFELEAQTVARLTHPNIVVLHSLEQANGIRFLTMEYVDGDDLRRLVKPGGLPVARVLEIAIPLADALAAAHARLIVHRDLKPANVMLSRDGRVKVLDFGLAKLLSESGVDSTVDAQISTTGQMVGTVAYMAPEQLRGQPIDERTDLFALGVLLFELVTGRRPFRGTTFAEMSAAILNDAPASLAAVRSDVPSELERLLGRCLEKDRERRIQTATDVRNELEQVRRDTDSGSRRSAITGGVAQSAPAPDRSTVAVLPFTNRGRSEDDEYFADGITEDVVAQLCKVRTLKVISCASVMSLKTGETDVRAIASQLGVETVLSGSVRRAGNRARIVAQLLDAPTGRSLWTESYDRELTDIFAVQSDVALQIANALRAELSADERQRINREPTHDVQAYEHFLRGRHSYLRFNEQGYRESIKHFDRALARDPKFALAYVGRAEAYTDLCEQASMSREEAGERAMSAATMALALDPDLSEAHAAYAHARLVFELDWEAAEAGYKRAIELSPSNADAYDLYGRFCAALGRFDEAVMFQERAFELAPLTHRSDIATSLIRAGRNEDAARAAQRAVEVDPDDPRCHATFGWALFRLGRIDEGLAKLEQAVAMSREEGIWLAQLGEAYGLAGKREDAKRILGRLQDPERPTASPYHLAFVHAGLGDYEAAMDCLERAFAARSGAIVGIKQSFLLAPLREHPRFIALLKRMKLS